MLHILDLVFKNKGKGTIDKFFLLITPGQYSKVVSWWKCRIFNSDPTFPGRKEEISRGKHGGQWTVDG
jgi:hypothetical protein